MADATLEILALYSTPVGPGEDDILSKKMSEDAATYYYYLERLFKTFNQTDVVAELQQKLESITNGTES